MNVRKGWHHTEEAKEKIRQKALRRTMSEKTKHLIALANTGKTHSVPADFGERMSNLKKEYYKTHHGTRLGMKNSEEHNRKVSKSRKGKPLPEAVKQKISKTIAIKGIRKDENNPMWKGDGVGYGALHNWVKRNLIKPQVCRDCNQPKPLDLANISGEYKRDLSDWEWLCRSCHMKKDGRLVKFLENGHIATRLKHLKKAA